MLKKAENIRQCYVSEQEVRALKALRMVRTDVGLTISELAERAGVSRDTISNAEKGRHELQATTLHKIARALGKTPSELLAEEERLAPKARRRSPFEPSFNDVLEEERRRAEMPGWARAGLEKSEFVERFERAKESEEAAYRLHREEIGNLEQAEARPGAIRAQNAPEGEVLAASREIVMAKARATTAAFLWAEALRGRDVTAMDPVEIVANVVEAQRELFEGTPDETASEAS